MLLVNLAAHSTAVEIILGLVMLAVVLRVGNVVRYIPNDQVGIVEKLWSARGSVEAGFIALAREAGFQPDILRGGIHFFFPFTYRVHRKPLVTIAQGKLGYVFARGGAPLRSAQALASNAPDEDFQDVRAFLARGGQKGPQRKVLREGTYALNLAQFVVLTDNAIYGVGLDDIDQRMMDEMRATIEERSGFVPVIIRDTEDNLGVVTVHDGPSLLSGEIIAPEVGGDSSDPAMFHENFQEPERFLAAGGRRGRQLQVLVEGTYFINRLFATVDIIPKTVIEIGTVGVVVSYTGPAGDDVSGELYRHGELVERGHRGVWQQPLLPGKYAFNVFAGQIVAVPTTNFVLKWMSSSTGSHKLDENLSEVTLITKDAFEPALPLSVVVHIDYQKAPQVVQRFGDVKRLVEQTLDPMVSAYFKDIGQGQTLIELLQKRAEIQTRASQEMRAKFLNYSLELQEVLIGTPKPQDNDQTVERILVQLRERQIAVEQVETYKRQGEAAVEERALNEVRSTAEMQTKLTQSAVQVRVLENEGAAALARATKDAETIRVTAQAEADRQRLEGDGEAARIAAVGAANAGAIDAQVRAYGGPEYRLTDQIAMRLFEAVAQGHQPVVPQIMVAGENGGAQSGLVTGLIASLLPTIRDRAAALPAPGPGAAPGP
jgi:uncharacterized membrane protein YqiK